MWRRRVTFSKEELRVERRGHVEWEAVNIMRAVTYKPENRLLLQPFILSRATAFELLRLRFIGYLDILTIALYMKFIDCYDCVF